MNFRKFNISWLVVLGFVALFFLQVHNGLTHPLMKGFDVSEHVRYIRLIQEEKRIPLANEGWELYQPPLYYLISSILPSLITVKLMGVVVWLGLMATSYWFFKNSFKSKNMGMVGGLLVGSIPVVVYMSQVISNEFFSGLMISIAMAYYLLNQNKLDKKKEIILGVLLGLALLSKATAIVLAVGIAIDQIIKNRNKKEIVNRIAKKVGVSFLVTLVIGGWFYLRNLIYFGNPVVTSVDFPQYSFTQKPGYRDIGFFTDLSGFFKLDMFRAHWYSLWAGTYFSFFYDAHNVIVPIQEFSKAGAALVVFSLPILGLILMGVIEVIRKLSDKNRLLVIYPVLLFASYIAYNLKLPFYSSVKGSFLISMVLPLGYFFLKGVEKLRKARINLVTLYLLAYVLLVVKNFWI